MLKTGKAWVNHAALNAGALLACVWHGLLPPRWTGHDEETINYLAETTPWEAFWRGLAGPT